MRRGLARGITEAIICPFPLRIVNLNCRQLFGRDTMLHDTVEREFRQESPRTLNVLALLVCSAGVFSYLGAYALTNALVAANIMEKWPADHDPRSRWMFLIFAALMGAFLVLAIFFKVTNWRAMRHSDKLADA